MRDSILVALLSWVVLAPFVFRHVPRDTRRSFSEHIATKGVTVWAARIAISLTALVIVTWYYMWYGPSHNNLIQSVLLSIVCASAILLSCIAYREGTRAGTAHTFFAWTYALLLLPLAVAFIIESESSVAKILIAALLAWQVIALSLFLFYKPSRKYFLYYQLSYITAFAMILLVVSYVPN